MLTFNVEIHNQNTGFDFCWSYYITLHESIWICIIYIFLFHFKSYSGEVVTPVPATTAGDATINPATSDDDDAEADDGDDESDDSSEDDGMLDSSSLESGSSS